MTQVVSLSFYRFDGAAARLWAFAMMGLARRAMARLPGVEFWKLCGSGVGEGFTPVPNLGVYAILCTWPDMHTARKAQKQAHIFARYRATRVRTLDDIHECRQRPRCLVRRHPVHTATSPPQRPPLPR